MSSVVAALASLLNDLAFAIRQLELRHEQAVAEGGFQLFAGSDLVAGVGQLAFQGGDLGLVVVGAGAEVGGLGFRR